MNVLFICSRNNWRSPTAEAIFKNRQDLNVRSAGTEPSVRIKVSAKLLDWADYIFVMEKKHKQRLSENFPNNISGKTIHNLDIPDEFEFMDEELINTLKIALKPFLDND